MIITREFVEELNLGLDLERFSPLPWEIQELSELSKNGYKIINANTDVIIAEDVEADPDDKILLVAIISKLMQMFSFSIHTNTGNG